MCLINFKNTHNTYIELTPQQYMSHCRLCDAVFDEIMPSVAWEQRSLQCGTFCHPKNPQFWDILVTSAFVIVFIIWLTLVTSLPALISNQNNINCSDIANNTKHKYFIFTCVGRKTTFATSRFKHFKSRVCVKSSNFPKRNFRSTEWY